MKSVETLSQDELTEHFSGEQIEELLADENLWELFEESFRRVKSGPNGAPRIAADDYLDELRERRDLLIEALMEEPGKLVMAGIIFLRHNRYAQRTLRPDDGYDRVEEFGTRSNYDSMKLDELYQIKTTGKGELEYRYTAWRGDYVFPRNFTMVVTDSGDLTIMAESFDYDEQTGRTTQVIEEVEDPKTIRYLVRQFVRTSFEASSLVAARSEGHAAAADEDARRRHGSLRRVEPYLYHVA